MFSTVYYGNYSFNINIRIIVARNNNESVLNTVLHDVYELWQWTGTLTMVFVALGSELLHSSGTKFGTLVNQYKKCCNEQLMSGL